MTLFTYITAFESIIYVIDVSDIFNIVHNAIERGNND